MTNNFITYYYEKHQMNEYLGITYSKMDKEYIYFYNVSDAEMENIFEKKSYDLFKSGKTRIFKSGIHKNSWIVVTNKMNEILKRIYDYRMSLYDVDGKKFQECEDSFKKIIHS